jgi:Lrp/AsnC family leucine-responsive transcriptional regulator
MIQLDGIDRRILIELQREGRLTNQDLADRIGLSPTACLRRTKRLEQVGVLSHYVALVDATLVGLEIIAFTRVSLERQGAAEIDQFERTVAAWPEVLECYLLTGDTDYQLKVVAGSLSEYETFLREKLTRTPGVAKIHSSLAFRPIVNRTALPL